MQQLEYNKIYSFPETCFTCIRVGTGLALHFLAGRGLLYLFTICHWYFADIPSSIYVLSGIDSLCVIEEAAIGGGSLDQTTGRHKIITIGRDKITDRHKIITIDRDKITGHRKITLLVDQGKITGRHKIIIKTDRGKAPGHHKIMLLVDRRKAPDHHKATKAEAVVEAVVIGLDVNSID